MALIQVQIGKNLIEDVLLDGGFGINIITKKLKVQLGLSKPKLAPYNVHMINQTIAKPLGNDKRSLNYCSWNSLCSNFYYNTK
jgi:hypothetical protein